MALPSVEDVRAEVKTVARGQLEPRPHRRGVVGHPRPVRLRGAARSPRTAGARATRATSSMVVNETIAEHGAVGPPAGLGYLLAAPTIVAHGNERQHAEDLLRILNGQDAWCQLFSEPGAGSDLAGLTTKAVKDGDEWHRHRPEGVDVDRADQQRRHADRAHRPRSPEAQGHHVLQVRHDAARRRDPPAARDDRPRDVQRGVHRQRARARRRHDRRAQQRLGGREHHARCPSAPVSAPAAPARRATRSPARSRTSSDDRVGDHVGQIRTGGTGGGGIAAANELMTLAAGARHEHRPPDPPEARAALHAPADRPVLRAARQVAVASAPAPSRTSPS